MEHGSYHFNYKLLPLHIRLFTLGTLKKANAIIAVSNFLKSVLDKKFPEQKIQVISNVVEIIPPLPFHTQNSKIKILSVGDLIEGKNFGGLIKAFKKLNAHNISLEIVGGGECLTELEKIAGEALNKNIFFSGKQSNEVVLQKLNECDFFVLNSNMETFCITGLEAIGAGKPVIITKCGGPEEYVHKDFGTLVEKNNEPDLINALNEMIVTYKNYDSKKMIHFVKENYSFEKVGKMLDEVYDEVIKDNNKS